MSIGYCDTFPNIPLAVDICQIQGGCRLFGGCDPEKALKVFAFAITAEEIRCIIGLSHLGNSMLASSSKYAIRALICLSDIPGGDFVPVPKLADLSGVPDSFLSKLIKPIADRGLVLTKKGPGGGVRLGTKPVSFYQICEVLADPIVVETCFLSSDRCNAQRPCPFHTTWSRERDRIISYLKRNKIKKARSSK